MMIVWSDKHKPHAAASGVYLIQVGAHSYVGSSKRIRQRINHHIHHLRKGNHSNPRLQAAYAKRGEISVSILCLCGESDRIAYEQRFIDGLNPDMNQSTTADNPMNDPLLVRAQSGEFNVSALYSDDQYKSVVLSLLDSRDLHAVADKTGVSFNVVAGISSGKSQTWLADEMPTEYAEMIAAKGSSYTVKQIREVLANRVETGSDFRSWNSLNRLMDRAQITLIRQCKRQYMKRIRAFCGVCDNYWKELEAAA